MRALAGAGLVGLAGCLDGLESAEFPDGASTAGEDGDATGTTAPGTSVAAPFPTRSEQLYVHDDFESLRGHVRGGGPGKDGIPSIDDPVFEPVDEVGDRLADDEPMLAIEIDGEAKAYPQSILVWHEIVNDTVGGRDLAVTYCPLTGTAIAYERAGVEFGVSGDLLNANLVMYDRETDSRWPQVLGTAIDGSLEGESLVGHPVTWSTWRDWRATNPDGVVLTRDTGSVRDYDRDPYGGYNPKTGYYASDSFLFAPIRESDRLPPKHVVHGVRSTDGAFAASVPTLATERVVTGAAGATSVVLVFDEALQSGVAYANPDDATVESDGDAYRVDGERREATALGLERLPSLDAMYFAWYGFYPDGDVRTGTEDASRERATGARGTRSSVERRPSG